MTDSVAFAAPILQGKTEDARLFAKEVTTRMDELDAARRPLGITRETVWIQPTPMGDFLVVLLEGSNVASANASFAASSSPFDTWFKERVLGFTGIDFGQPIPVLPEIVVDYRV